MEPRLCTLLTSHGYLWVVCFFYKPLQALTVRKPANSAHAGKMSRYLGVRNVDHNDTALLQTDNSTPAFSLPQI